MSTPPPVWPPQPGQPSPYGAPQSNSNGTLILVLGILSIVFGCFGVILGPIAWVMGNNALKTGMVDPSQLGQINAGRICGIIGTVLGILALIYLIVVFGVIGTAALHHPTTTSFPAPTSGQ